MSNISNSKIVIGVYKEKPYCFGNKKYCKMYLELHRHLKKNEYELLEYPNENSIINTYVTENPEIEIIYENELILTKRDFKWIEEDMIDLSNLKQETLFRIYEMLKLLQYNGKNNEELITNLTKSYKGLYEISDETFYSLLDTSTFYHPLVSMHMDEYSYKIKPYLEREYLKERYKENVSLD